MGARAAVEERWTPIPLWGCPSASAGAPGLSQQWVPLLRLGRLASVYIPLEFDESSVEGDELFYRRAYKTYPRIHVHVYLRESS